MCIRDRNNHICVRNSEIKDYCTAVFLWRKMVLPISWNMECQNKIKRTVESAIFLTLVTKGLVHFIDPQSMDYLVQSLNSPFFPPHKLNPGLYGAGRKESSGTGLWTTTNGTCGLPIKWTTLNYCVISPPKFKVCFRCSSLSFKEAQNSFQHLSLDGSL